MLSQEMGFDSIPFEEPELFAAGNEPEAKGWLADKRDNSLHLRLDSQDDLGSSLAEVGIAASLHMRCCSAKLLVPKNSLLEDRMCQTSNHRNAYMPKTTTQCNLFIVIAAC